MSFRMAITELGERCDLCDQIDASRPMLELNSYCRESGHKYLFWIHLDEFERKLAKLKAKKTKESRP